jgi:hypothetical protein
MDIELQLKSIQGKLQQMVKQHQLLLKENARLNKELEKAKTTIAEKAEQFSTLQQKADAIKLRVTEWNPEEKVELEQRIDVYLKEIEKCLALLNA